MKTVDQYRQKFIKVARQSPLVVQVSGDGIKTEWIEINENSIEAIQEFLEECKIDVHFRKHADGDVVAVFPTEEWDKQGHAMSYAHIGQHDAADRAIITEWEPATTEESKPLADELRGLGYILNILP